MKMQYINSKMTEVIANTNANTNIKNTIIDRLFGKPFMNKIATFFSDVNGGNKKLLTDAHINKGIHINPPITQTFSINKIISFEPSPEPKSLPDQSTQIHDDSSHIKNVPHFPPIAQTFSINDVINFDKSTESKILTPSRPQDDGLPDFNRIHIEQKQKEENNQHLKLIYPNPNIISYDLFDTLIFRYCKEPHLIFDLVQEKVADPNYKKKRMHAEHISSNTIFNTNVDDIYNVMKTHYDYDEETIEFFKRVEIETEIEQIFPNNELFLKLKENDIIVSDMYLKEEHLRRIVQKCFRFNQQNGIPVPSINPDTIKIYVSGGGKHAGWIWDKISERESINYHIGDNFVSDYEVALKHNIPAIHYKGTPYYHTETYLIQNRNLELANLIRYIRLLNPYDPNLNPTEQLIYELQPTINIPILILTCKYLHDLDKNIAFHLRDSYYIKLLYDVLYVNDQRNTSIFLFTSRYIYNNADEEYIQYYNSVVDKDTVLFDLQGSGNSYSNFTIKNKSTLTFPNAHLFFLFYFQWNNPNLMNSEMITSIGGIDRTLAQIELLNITHLNSTIELKNGIFYKNRCEFNVKHTDIILKTVLLSSRMLYKLKNTNFCTTQEMISYIYNNNNLYNFNTNKDGLNLLKYFPSIEHKKDEGIVPTVSTKYNLVSFHTCGPPYDNARNLSVEGKLFENLFIPFMDSVCMYNTQKCLQQNPFFLHYYVTSYPEVAYPEYTKGEHARGSNHGFWKWKSYIVKMQLEKIKMGDVLIYHDCNIDRYQYYMKDIYQFRENVQYILKKTNTDIIIPIEHPDLLCKHHVKKSVFETVGENNDDYRNFPLLNANRIFIKKSVFSVRFINEWADYCNYGDLILPETAEEPDLRWHTHDQAILSVLYKKYINIGSLHKLAPGFYIKDKTFSKENIIFF